MASETDPASARRQSPDAPSGDQPAAKDKPKKKGLLQRPVLLVSFALAFILLAGGALLWWLHARHFESTDDAFIDAHVVRLAPQIAGRVTQVLVSDNQLVRAGEPMVILDSADIATRVAQAQAQKAQAQAQVDNALAQIQVNQAAYQQSLADIAAARAPAANAATDLARYRNLAAINPAAVAQQQLDQAQALASQTAAQLQSAVRASRTRAEQVTASRTQVAAGREQVRASEAQLNDASINLGYAQIVAPIDGNVAEKTVAIGNYVQPGTELLAIVPLRVWITANFKETQLPLMRVGQSVDVRVDACAAKHITGRVQSIQRGAGQAFAILPPQNATGNFVKVVQRVPVKILLDNPPSDCPLGPGMSVEPRVRVR
jgi:membrane fusion protein (multidrug efflux system)